MPIKLKSRVNWMLTFHLPAEVAPQQRMSFTRVENREDGAVAQRDVRMVLPDTLTLLAKAESRELPDSMRTSPEVKAAEAAGHIFIEDVKLSQQAATLPASAPAEPPKARAKVTR